MLKYCFALTVLALAMNAIAANPVELTFNRTGTDAPSVTITASGESGVTATLLSVNTPMKGTAGSVTSSILCPNVNATSNPTIVLEFVVNGLPGDYTIGSVDLDIHALNGSNGYQDHGDGKDRLWNVSVALNDSEFGLLRDVDIAAGVNSGSSERHKLWNIPTDNPVQATSPLTIEVTVTAGTANVGCFFGLSSIRLNPGEGSGGSVVDPDPKPELPSDGSLWLLKWKANTSDYIRQSGSKFVVGEMSESASCFWELIPTDNENCYYLKNHSTGMYMGSCNMTPSSSSKIQASETPVEYYIGHTSSTSSEIKGCVWLSSTDCAGYNTENSTRALNKDGASSDIITWRTNSASETCPGSYWTLVPYEDRPFTPASEIGDPVYFYYIKNSEGQMLTHSLDWADRKADESQKWYFVGTANAAGGYLVVPSGSGQAAFDGRRFVVSKAEVGVLYTLTDSDGARLEVEGFDEFSFAGFRDLSAFALKSQIYTMPCGSLGSNYVTSVTIDSDRDGISGFRYPMASLSGGELTYPLASRPSHRYTMLSRDRAEIGEGEFAVNITLNSEPSQSDLLIIYFDWDRDGYFETMKILENSASVSTIVAVPETAIPGESRMRIRLTSNGLTEADDDVAGQVLDLFVNYDPVESDLVNPVVKVNAPNRGKAVYNASTQTASATAYGTAVFICWKEDDRFYSVSPVCEAAPSVKQHTLTAVFSPNLETVGIGPLRFDQSDSSTTVVIDRRKLMVISDSEPKAVFLFSTDGELVVNLRGVSSVDLSGLPDGIYIAKVLTEHGASTAKVLLK
ncbi:MAG: T9SS type A sorting domain-containing protein [Clostridium sp.]|nr:T9SS type A sorting domain-containing protein [Clostridium sp.]